MNAVFALMHLPSDIATADIANMVSRLSSKVYITQEVIYGAGEVSLAITVLQ